MGNTAAVKTGVHSFARRGPSALPPDLRQSVEDFRAQVIADRGGVEALSAIEAGFIRRLSELETVSRLLSGNLAEHGVFTKRGRVRSAYTQWLATLDRWDRFAQRVGIERRARHVPSLEEYLNATVETESGENFGGDADESPHSAGRP